MVAMYWQKLRSFLRKNPLKSLTDFQLEHPPGQIVNRQLVGNDLSKGHLLTLKAVLEFSRRVLDRGMGMDTPITSPADVLPEIRFIRDLKKENFVAIFLNARNQVIKTDTISMGSSQCLACASPRSVCPRCGHKRGLGDTRPQPSLWRCYAFKRGYFPHQAHGAGWTNHGHRNGRSFDRRL